MRGNCRASESEEEKRGKPDVILNLPGNRCLIVDSKVSIDAYVAHCSTEEPLELQAHLKRHLDSLRSRCGNRGGFGGNEVSDASGCGEIFFR